MEILISVPNSESFASAFLKADIMTGNNVINIKTSRDLPF